MKEAEEITNLNIAKNICVNCLNELIRERENYNNLIIKDIEDYKKSNESILKEFNNKENEELSKINIDDLRIEEEKLIEKLKELEKNEELAQKELDMNAVELSNYYKTEQAYWDIFNQLEDCSYKLEKNKQYTFNRYKIYETEIKQFSSYNILNSLFNISSDDNYGKINGARLGCPANSLIPDEVNSALGYVVYLTAIIAKKCNFEFKKYELIPMGNYSKILKKEQNSVYELTFTGSSSNLVDKFNDALKAYLEALKELHEHIFANLKKSDNLIDGMNLNIENGKLNGFSIELSIKEPEKWNECMKYLLIILKNYIFICLKKEEEEYNEVIKKIDILTNISVNN